jgi:hypothetical protein
VSTFRHPSELNSLQRFLQARKVLRTTSRATNPHWFSDPLQVPVQLHVRVDGVSILTWWYFLAENRWDKGPVLSEAALTEPEPALAFATSVLSSQLPPQCNALGVILHIADEFATTALDPDHDTPAALKDLRQLIEKDPARVLDDSSLSPDDHSWRIFPFPGTGAPNFATAIAIGRRLDPFLAAFRQLAEQRSFPVRTCALSSPLIALRTLPYLITQPLARPVIAALHYPNVTILAFLNGHGDLLLLRTLQHRGHGRPVGLRHAATTTAAALEIDQPDLLVLPLADSNSTTVAEDLQLAFPQSALMLVDWAHTIFAALPRPEPIACRSDLADQPGPLAGSVTFSSLHEEGWATQDFLPTPLPQAERYPTRNEIRLLQAARLIQLGLAAAAVLVLSWMFLSIIGIMRQPEWAFNPTSAKTVKQRLSVLNSDRDRVEMWDNLLADRSKAWVNLELLCQLFPARSHVLLRSVTHTARPEAKGLNIKPAAGKTAPSTVGFVREWRISGFARDEAEDLLNTISSQEGISAVFATVAKQTGNPAFQPNLPSRSITVKRSSIENASFKARAPEEITDSDEATYPFTFELIITQRFESNDPVALATGKAPSL